MRAGLREETFKYIEGIVRSYHQYEKWIKQREAEIYNPPKIEEDENIGGGRSPYLTNETERIATKLVLDKQLQSLREEYSAVKYAFSMCKDEREAQVIHLFYVQRKKTWEGVADETKYSRRQCMNIRDVFIKRVAEYMGKT
ncbi:hypothetical protein NHG29_04140 [Aerococcaceae bacterium NML160702]|nr:hypothetical protein [Aerococcaceae bacterium NML160702]